MPKKDIKNHRLLFSDIGFAYVVYAIVTFVLQNLIAYMVKSYAPNFYKSQFFLWVGSFLPMYLVGFPICLLIFKKIPKDNIPKKSIPISKYYAMFSICIFATSFGNILGKISLFAVNKLTGYTSTSALLSLMTPDNVPYILIFAVFLAPIIEELLFRKFLIDRIKKYGDLTAILFSGILFGIYHGNLEQLFYSTFLGLFFALIYVKTGRIRYSMALHIIINFLGSFVPMMILSGLSEQNLNALNSGNLNLLAYSPKLAIAIGVLLIYLFIFLISSLLGLFYFIKAIKKLTFSKNEFKLSTEEIIASIFLNLGMLSLIIVCCLKFFITL